MLGSAQAYQEQPLQTGGDHYETPTPQIIMLRGSTCIESISLPLLQQYYVNMNTVNRDYAMFKVTYFDFPMADSVIKLKNYVPFVWLNFIIEVDARYTQKLEYHWARINEHRYEGPGQFTNPNPKFTYGFRYPFYINQIKSIDNVITQLNKVFTEIQSWAAPDQLTATDFTHSNTVWVGPTNLPASTNFLKVFFNWFKGFMFDSDAKKIAVEYNKPSELVVPDSWVQIPPHPYDIFLSRINLTVEYTDGFDKGDELLMSMMGGKKHNNGWISEFDSDVTNFFLNAAMSFDQHPANTGMVGQTARVFTEDALFVHCKEIPRVFLDQYVYVRGTPESSIWSPDGSTNNLMAIQPRNKITGMTAQSTAFITDQTHATKTTLSSLRNMQLYFTDKDGHLLQIDDDYLIKIGITFNI